MAALAGRLLAFREYPDDPERVEDWTQQIRVSIRNLRTDQFITAGYASDVDIPRLSDIPTLDGLYRRTAHAAARRHVHGRGLHAAARRRTSAERVGRRLRPVAVGLHDDLHDPASASPGAPHIRMTFPFFGDELGRIEVGPPDDRDGRADAGREPAHAHLRALPATARGRRDAGGLRPGRPRTTWATSRSRTPSRRRRRRARSTGSCSTPRPATASSTRARWRCCCAWAASRRGSSPASRPARRTPRPASTWCATSTPTRGSRSTTPTGAGSRSTRRPPPRRRAASPPTRRAQRQRRAGSGPRFGDAARPSAARGIAGRGRGEAVVVLADPRPGGPRRGRAVLFARLRRRRRGAPPALTELERALRRTRRAPAPGTTLHALEQRFSAHPGGRRLRARAAREPLRATPRSTRPAPSAAGCGPSSDAGPACSVVCVPGGPSRP